MLQELTHQHGDKKAPKLATEFISPATDPAERPPISTAVAHSVLSIRSPEPAARAIRTVPNTARSVEEPIYKRNAEPSKPVMTRRRRPNCIPRRLVIHPLSGPPENVASNPNKKGSPV